MKNYKAVLFFIFIALASSGCGSSDAAFYESGVSSSLTQDEIIYDHWEDAREYLPSSTTIEACSSSAGNCYDLDADISDGYVDTIYFDNGGYLDFAAEIDSEGTANDSDYHGDYWDFQINQDDIDQAIRDWADYNEIEVTY